MGNNLHRGQEIDCWRPKEEEEEEDDEEYDEEEAQWVSPLGRRGRRSRQLVAL